RDFHVTGVQTCALPIFPSCARCLGRASALGAISLAVLMSGCGGKARGPVDRGSGTGGSGGAAGNPADAAGGGDAEDGEPGGLARSEERRVGREWGGGWA